MHQLLTRDHVLLTFEKFRATPGAPFDEGHFLDFLLANPSGIGAVRNSFAGLHRFNKFMDAIQLEWGICFSQADLERSFSIDSFVDRANALQASRKGSLASLKSRERAGAGWTPVVILDLILVGIAVGFENKPAVSVTALAFAAVISGAFAVFAIRNRRGLARLRSRIESGLAPPPPDRSQDRAREE
jgi:hypothetical protein